MVEVVIYLIAGAGALFITGFAVHMFVGGLVSPELENQLIMLICLIVVGVMSYMGWDIIQSRKGNKK